MNKFNVALAIKLALMASVLIIMMVVLLRAFDAISRWGGCWACG